MIWQTKSNWANTIFLFSIDTILIDFVRDFVILSLGNAARARIIYASVIKITSLNFFGMPLKLVLNSLLNLFPIRILKKSLLASYTIYID